MPPRPPRGIFVARRRFYLDFRKVRTPPPPPPQECVCGVGGASPPLRECPPSPSRVFFRRVLFWSPGFRSPADLNRCRFTAADLNRCVDSRRFFSPGFVLVAGFLFAGFCFAGVLFASFVIACVCSPFFFHRFFVRRDVFAGGVSARFFRQFCSRGSLSSYLFRRACNFQNGGP